MTGVIKMKVLSFNARCPWKDYDGINDFIHRAGFIYDKVRAEKPDVIAFQEIRNDSRELLIKMFPEYEFFGTFREENYSVEGLYTAIKKSDYVYMGCEFFWLSPTPYKIASKFPEQSGCSRICVMTTVRNLKTNEVFRFLNIHLDHIPGPAQINGLKCVFEFMDEYDKKNKLPTILMGDFNVRPDSETYRFAKAKEGYFDATSAIDVTFHGFGKEAVKYDYIFLSDDLKARVGEVTTWTDCHEGIYLSDHYPVCLEITDK